MTPQFILPRLKSLDSIGLELDVILELLDFEDVLFQLFLDLLNLVVVPRFELLGDSLLPGQRTVGLGQLPFGNCLLFAQFVAQFDQ